MEGTCFIEDIHKFMPINVDHETQTFKMGEHELNRHEVMSLATAFIAYYRERPFIDKKENVMDAVKFLNTMSNVKKG